jgi:hypothetical protein
MSSLESSAVRCCFCCCGCTACCICALVIVSRINCFVFMWWCVRALCVLVFRRCVPTLVGVGVGVAGGAGGVARQAVRVRGLCRRCRALRWRLRQGVEPRLPARLGGGGAAASSCADWAWAWAWAWACHVGGLVCTALLLLLLRNPVSAEAAADRHEARRHRQAADDSAARLTRGDCGAGATGAGAGWQERGRT